MNAFFSFMLFFVEWGYVVGIHCLVMLYTGLWWNLNILPNTNGVQGNLLRAVVGIIVYSIFAIDGYRRLYKKNRKAYFYASCISPLAFSIPVFLWGFIHT